MTLHEELINQSIYEEYFEVIHSYLIRTKKDFILNSEDVIIGGFICGQYLLTFQKNEENGNMEYMIIDGGGVIVFSSFSFMDFIKEVEVMI